jgi:hypothetical protein
MTLPAAPCGGFQSQQLLHGAEQTLGAPAQHDTASERMEFGVACKRGLQLLSTAVQQLLSRTTLQV